MAKNLYHSALIKMGDVTADVRSDVLKSKYPNKPDYVELEIDGESYYYSTENEQCAAFFNGLKGRRIEFRAVGGGRGKEDTANLELIAEGPHPTERKASAERSRTPAEKPPRQQQPAAMEKAEPPAKGEKLHPQLGIRVGACLNNAINYLIAESHPWDPKEILDRTSDLLRISEYLEKGHISPPFSERRPEKK